MAAKPDKSKTSAKKVQLEDKKVEASVGEGTAPHKWSIFYKLLILGVTVALVVVFVRLSSRSQSADIGAAKLTNIATYLSKSSGDMGKIELSSFAVGDPIQVGFSYEGTEDSQTFVRFVVKNQESGKVSFETNAFKLDEEPSELFVSINNTNLPAGEYVVELQDVQSNTIAQHEYTIKE